MAGVKFVSAAGKDQYARVVAEVRFVSTIWKDQNGSYAILLDTLPG